MQYQRLKAEEKVMRRDRQWVYGRATVLQDEQGLTRARALKEAWRELRQRTKK